MSSSWNTEQEIEKTISELNEYVMQLESCLEIIRGVKDLNTMNHLREKVKDAKERAKRWMK